MGGRPPGPADTGAAGGIGGSAEEDDGAAAGAAGGLVESCAAATGAAAGIGGSAAESVGVVVVSAIIYSIPCVRASLNTYQHTDFARGAVDLRGHTNM